MKHLRLIIDVTYDDAGVPVEVLKGILKDIPKRAANEGLLSGYTPATVDRWSYRIEEIDDLAIESGSITPGRPRES